MALSEFQLKKRLSHIGSSDSPRILGFSPFGNASDVFFEKVPDYAGTVKEIARKDTPSIKAGNALENVILQHAVEDLGVSIVRNQFRVSKEERLFSATFDALIPDRPDEAIEAKSTGVHYRMTREQEAEWGEQDTDQVPETYLIQCQHQCFVGDLSRVWLFAFIGGRGFLRYKIDRNDKVIGVIVEQGLNFWKFVENRLPPDPSALPPMEMLKAVVRRDGDPVTLSPEGCAALTQLQEAKRQIKYYENQEKLCKRLVISELGDRESALSLDGEVFTYKEQTRKTVDTKRLSVEHPEIFEQYQREITFRVPRIKKPKSNSIPKEEQVA